MTINGQRVNLEIQVDNEGNYPERSLFHWAREYSTALPKGEDYSALPRTIIISIVHFKMFDCKEFVSKFTLLEMTRHTPLTDKIYLYFFELTKLPRSITAEDGLKLWLSLFRAKTEEDLAQIEGMEVPVMNEAIRAYRHVSAAPEFREMERMRSKMRHDEAQAMKSAEQRGEKRERKKWENVVANQETLIVEQGTALVEKDIALAEKDALIAELQARLGKS